MRTVVDGAIRADPELAGAVERASRVVESELGASSGRAAAEWDLARDERGRPTLRLTLEDREAGEARSVEFEAGELGDESRLRGRVSRLWDGVLQADIEKRLARIHEALQTIEDG